MCGIIGITSTKPVSSSIISTRAFLPEKITLPFNNLPVDLIFISISFLKSCSSPKTFNVLSSIFLIIKFFINY